MFKLRGGYRSRGSVTTIIAAIAGLGVLVGMGALVVDVGQIYTERTELQSGADAAAVAVAKLCANGYCPSDPVTAARTAANSNAKDGKTNVTVCGLGINGIAACPPVTKTLTKCIGTPTPGASYIEVRTTTLTDAGSTVLPPSLSRTLAGNDAYQGQAVMACARAAFTPGMTGRVWEANAIALTVWVCYWSMYTTNGASYPSTNGSIPPASKEQILYLKDSRPNGNGQNGTTYCPEGPNGQNAPGNWGWLDDTTGAKDCKATITTGNFVGGDPGNNTPAGCEAFLNSMIASKQPMLIPLYDAVSGNGNNVKYHIAGYAGWVVTGYKLSGSSKKSWLSNANLCSGQERCIYGYFTYANFTNDVLKVENGTDFGANTQLPPKAKLVG